MSITGTLVQSYAVCPRQAWLMARQMEPEREFELLVEGRLNQLEHYERSMKEIELPGIKLDRVRREGGRLVFSEIKKSTRYLPAARLQVGYYLLRLREEGIEASGEILVPKERFREEVELTPRLEEAVRETVKKLEQLLVRPLPPPAERIRYCSKCAYAEFCWS
ncbi:MAG: CRISPR-associated protein Cas4 [Rubrobacteraceae bacterium]|nr:CRISPR-associated protein Cas4 [Rubrobacteraceae bacterium]